MSNPPSALEQAQQVLDESAAKIDADNFVQLNILIALARFGSPEQQQSVMDTLDKMGKHAANAGVHDVAHAVERAEFYRGMIFK